MNDRMNGLPSPLAASPEGPLSELECSPSRKLARRGERVPAAPDAKRGERVRGKRSYHHPHLNPPPSGGGGEFFKELEVPPCGRGASLFHASLRLHYIIENKWFQMQKSPTKGNLCRAFAIGVEPLTNS